MAEAAETSCAGAQPLSRGKQPFARRVRTHSLFERMSGKPAKKIMRLGGLLMLLAVGGRYIVPAAESSSWLSATLERSWNTRASSPGAEERRRLAAGLCYPNASDAATGYHSCVTCMKALTPRDMMADDIPDDVYTYPAPVAMGARCYCGKDQTCDRKKPREPIHPLKNPCELKPADSDDPGACMKVDKPPDCGTTFPPTWGMLPIYLIIVMYCFLGLAVVCDELFVPALEIMAEKMELSNDVAGATLMAAGGSAPELATSLIGTFQGSDVGMGTIVGSAVFNVLFVIGMCAMSTPPQFAPLQLTWWPLARDCTYYLFTLISLYVWFAVTSPGEITPVEACIQFAEYFGYVVLMKFSEPLEKWVKSKLQKDEKGRLVQVAPANGEYTQGDPVADSAFADPNADFLRPSTFRTGIYQLLTQSKSMTDTAGIHVVTRIKGDVNTTFAELDKNGNGSIDKEELAALFQQLAGEGQASTMKDEEVQKIYNQLDVNKDGSISKEEFTMWYTGSEQRLKDDVRKIFKELDTNSTDTITSDELLVMLKKLGHNPAASEVSEIESQINKTSGEGITLDDFTAWYEKSLFWTAAKDAAEDAQEAEAGMYASVMSGISELGDPEKPFGAKAMFVATLPLSLAFAFTVPDCRPPGKEWLCWLGFFMSIVWIGIFTYPMVESAAAIGDLFGIPIVIMGLTFLAAGTSVPDLLSSVIVAKQGQGDMAVSSSIGSNIFDVAVGLPLPWLIFGFSFCPVCVESGGGIVISLSILIAMVFLVIVTIAASGFKMTNTLGKAMFGMYVFFCLQDISRTYIPALGGGKPGC